jgi:hypothetical protein
MTIMQDGNSSTAVSLKYKYLVFPGMLGNLVTFEQPETLTITIDFNKQILSGRFPSCLQSLKFKATSLLRCPIDWGSSLIAVSLKFKYITCSVVSGYILRFEQPERLRALRYFDLMILGRLKRFVQLLRSKSTSFSRN